MAIKASVWSDFKSVHNSFNPNMQVIALLIVVLSLSAAEWIEIDWSNVRPIEDFDHYWARLPAELQHYRHSEPEPDRRIVNGREATPGQFPYQAVSLSELPLGTAVCGATILTANYILTAAHCVQGASGGIAIMGAHNRFEDEPSQQRIAYTVEDINIHPGYTLMHIRNDIATVRMGERIIFNDRVVPVRLPARSDRRTFAGMMGTVSGYGRTSDDHNELSAVMRYALNPIITNANCLAASGNNVDMIQAQNICQSGVGGRGACQSDSGGPLTVLDAGSPLQVGVVSFGSLACKDGLPTAFARITYFLDWIEENSDVVIEP